MLVSNIRPALTLIYKLGGKSDFGVKPKHTHTKRENKTKQKSLVYIQTLKIEHAGHNRGWTSRVSQQPYRTTEHSYSGGSAVITKHRLGLHTRERSHCAGEVLC